MGRMSGSSGGKSSSGNSSEAEGVNTRSVRLRADVDRASAYNEGTACFPMAPPPRRRSRGSFEVGGRVAARLGAELASEPVSEAVSGPVSEVVANRGAGEDLPAGSLLQPFPALGLETVRSVFLRHQRRIAERLAEHTQPGVAVFALHPERGLAGNLWLRADETIRAGTIGRHSRADLYLADEPALSLRHLAVLVRRRGGSVWVRLVDLSTPFGFQAEAEAPLRAVEGYGTFFLRVAGYVLFVVPSGGPLPWDSSAADPWATLPPRTLLAEGRPSLANAPPGAAARGAGRRRAREMAAVPNPREVTVISEVHGPVEAASSELLAPGERRCGQLRLLFRGWGQLLEVGATSLGRGILLGRYGRCAGDTAGLDGAVSRVHALVVELDGVVHLVDLGSTNGTLLEGRAVKCEPVEPGATYVLGGLSLRWLPV